MAEIQAMNMADAASAISAILAPEKGQAEVDETQPVEESEEDLEAAASEDDESGVEDAPDEEASEEQSGEEEEQEKQVVDDRNNLFLKVRLLAHLVIKPTLGRYGNRG